MNDNAINDRMSSFNREQLECFYVVNRWFLGHFSMS